ncbi:hypothetical protein TPL01_29310 [Sulfuriferula plumbiphila]|uniref:Tc1-like transposase DDE domain-containing protein n=1 Tax=Sulfuriferula plumbiphila TaxID=171865 RepID=A0A512LBD2_9PROT|nr:hypothetical protein TPL01_29310 [Sulfuriferula plumbiphila]
MFRFHERSIKKEEIVEFLKALKAHLKQPLLIVLDGLRAHKLKPVREYLDSTKGPTFSSPSCHYTRRT